jgi:dephospho-CoA kinase
LAFAEIAERFPAVIVNGEIDRGLLRSIVSADAEKRLLLESIVHPAVSIAIDEKIKTIARKDSGAVILRHAPLLIESGVYKKMDFNILIWCEPEIQLERLKKRGYPPYEDALKLMQSQMPYEEKLKYARHVINNNGTEEEAALEVDRVFELVKMVQYGEKHI